jgi:hypothetical protein
LNSEKLLTEIEVASENFSAEATDMGSTLHGAMEAAAGFARSRGVSMEPEPAEAICKVIRRCLDAGW